MSRVPYLSLLPAQGTAQYESATLEESRVVMTIRLHRGREALARPGPP